MSSTELRRTRSKSDTVPRVLRSSPSTDGEGEDDVLGSSEGYEDEDVPSVRPLRPIPDPLYRRRKKQRMSEAEAENRAARNDAVEELAKTTQARAAAEIQRLEQERLLLQQARGDAEAQFVLKRKLFDAQQNAAEIDGLVQKVKELSSVEEIYARKRAERRLEVMNQQKKEALAKAKAELKELQRLKKIKETNREFKRKEGRWIGEVAGILGMDSIDELLHMDGDDGLYQASKHLESARIASLKVIQRYVCPNMATWAKLKTEHAFLRLIAAYYLRFSNFSRSSNRRTSLRSSNLAVEQHVYEILLTVFSMDSSTIAAKMLGKLNRCQ